MFIQGYICSHTTVLQWPIRCVKYEIIIYDTIRGKKKLIFWWVRRFETSLVELLFCIQGILTCLQNYKLQRRRYEALSEKVSSAMKERFWSDLTFSQSQRAATRDGPCPFLGASVLSNIKSMNITWKLNVCLNY